jgi:hypothetical protein
MHRQHNGRFFGLAVVSIRAAGDFAKLQAVYSRGQTSEVRRDRKVSLGFPTPYSSTHREMQAVDVRAAVWRTSVSSGGVFHRRTLA